MTTKRRKCPRIEVNRKRPIDPNEAVCIPNKGICEEKEEEEEEEEKEEEGEGQRQRQEENQMSFFPGKSRIANSNPVFFNGSQLSIFYTEHSRSVIC
ncbi:hypothetical protein E2C01_042984 [Portunus trituberculatus]|uniref:Uncharacterized protein n=1 Tax=Portunus trituberculatus TaxID=210409 RepID=A0A5B7FV38_PORTR|nr:hypothetical protein [Portunus trituberculatus]